MRPPSSPFPGRNMNFLRICVNLCIFYQQLRYGPLPRISLLLDHVKRAAADGRPLGMCSWDPGSQPRSRFYLVAQFPVASAVRYALMKPSRSPSITLLMALVS